MNRNDNNNSNKTTRSSTISISKEKLAFILISLIAIIFLLCSFNHTENTYKRSETLKPNTAVLLDDNWYTLDGDTRQNIVLPLKTALEGTDELTIYRQCSASEINRGILMVHNNRQQIEVSLDDECIFKLAEGHEDKYTSVNGYSLIKLDKTDNSHILSVTYSKCRENICDIDSIILCSPSEAFVHMLSLDGSSFILLLVLGIIMIGTGLFCIYYLIKRLYNPELYCLFFLLLFVFGWIATNMWLSTLLPLSYQTVFHIDYTALMCLPIPISLFAYYSTLNYKSKALVLVIYLGMINVVVQQLIFISGLATFYDMLIFTHVVLFITAITSMFAQIKSYKIKPSLHGRNLILTFVLPLAIFIVAMILFWLVEGSAYVTVFLVGMFGFISLFIFDIIQSILQSIYESKQNQTKLEVFQLLSVKDGLTGLNNRRSFDECLDKVDIGNLEDAVLFFLDVNQLKATNDTYGHNAGDELIKGAAECISKTFEPYGKCFRLGGDEFAALVENPQLTDEEYLKALEDNITRFNIGRTISLSIAKGCDHLYNHDHIKRNISLWKSNADKAMYADKMRTKMLLDNSENHGIVSENIDALSGILTMEGFQKNALHIIYHNPQQKYALWYFDVKKFKFVNDFFGYELGDKLIKYMGKIFLESVHENETCGRISGNTIVSLIKIHDDYTIEEYFNYIQKSIGNFFVESKVNYKVEIAAGIYILNEEDKKCPDINQMLDWANVAQKSVKNLNGDRYALFGEEMWRTQWRDLYINQTLDEAIKNKEISIWLQPQYDYFTGKICGGEALARWTHNSLGWISPGEFIPALEKTGQIPKLDYYIWEEACKLIQRWRLSNTMEPISLSVNISRIDVMEGNIISNLNHLTEKYQIPPSSLRLEITESAYMNRPDALIETVNALHENGYMVEMDDFGSGFSSLNMLKDVSVDLLKIDVNFLQGDYQREKGSKIIAAIIQMAHELEIPVLTEGVENKQQAQYLSGLGCSLMQGFYFSKPLPIGDFENLLKEQKLQAVLETEQTALGGIILDDEDLTDSSTIKKVFTAEYYINTQGYIVKCDNAFTELTGYSIDDVYEMKLSQNDLIPADSQKSYWATVQKQMQHSPLIILKHEIICKSGKRITVHCEGFPLIDEYSGENRTRIRIQSTMDE